MCQFSSRHFQALQFSDVWIEPSCKCDAYRINSHPVAIFQADHNPSCTRCGSKRRDHTTCRLVAANPSPGRDKALQSRACLHRSARSLSTSQAHSRERAQQPHLPERLIRLQLPLFDQSINSAGGGRAIIRLSDAEVNARPSPVRNLSKFWRLMLASGSNSRTP
jgi:hypothetical protein